MSEHARQVSSVVRETEPLIRSHHPSLKDSKIVFVCDKTDTSTWIIPHTVQSRWYDGTEAAGKKIRVLSPFQSRLLSLSSDIYFHGPFISNLNCGRILLLSELREIRQFFPGAATAIAIVKRRIVVTFPTKEAIQACWVARIAEKVGQQMKLCDDEYNKDDIIFELRSSSDMGTSDRQNNRAIRLQFFTTESIIVVVPEELIRSRNVLPDSENILASLMRRINLTS